MKQDRRSDKDTVHINSGKKDRKPCDAIEGNLIRRLVLGSQRGLAFHTHMPESETRVERPSPGPVLDTVPDGVCYQRNENEAKRMLCQALYYAEY